jgi:hypothetical protein
MGWLLTSYLRAYGPARPEDFARWLATDVRWAREIFDRHADRLRPLDLEGSRMWILADQTVDAPTAETIRLRPYFDSCLVGGQPRELLVPGRARDRAQPPGGGAGNYPVVLVDGVVAGVWHQRRTGRRRRVTVEMLRRSTRKLRVAIEHAVLNRMNPAAWSGPEVTGRRRRAVRLVGCRDDSPLRRRPRRGSPPLPAPWARVRRRVGEGCGFRRAARR